MNKLQTQTEELLRETGVRINGSRSFDIQVHNDALYKRVFSEGSLGLGEAYMDEWWECEDLEEFFYRLLSQELDRKLHPVRLAGTWARAKLLNLQSPARAFAIGEHHYDIGDNLYEAMLDKRMIYSCGYWKQTRSLNKAQEQKLDLIFRKLGLRKGMRVLDIGCGWGGSLQYAAEKYGVEGVGITVSRNQAEKAREMCRDYPVEIRLQDYRELDETFDRIWSIGMIEHVGVKNYRRFMQVARECLKSDGLFLLHTIGGNRSVHKTDPWIGKYIFPNSMIPSVRQLGLAWEDLFVMEDWHNFGVHYQKTLQHWYRNVRRHQDRLLEKYGDRFFRMWRYYLQSCAGAFKARKLNVWQIVLSPSGIPGGYERPE
ncbi:cyclopropane fatty acyl phospholipid synthase [Balneolales bacterium ANBcel1]|nr:cyclopropane fatty acyl phospholipid synthase [Balneolales bacterium ANBcel1]